MRSVAFRVVVCFLLIPGLSLCGAPVVFRVPAAREVGGSVRLPGGAAAAADPQKLAEAMEKLDTAYAQVDYDVDAKAKAFADVASAFEYVRDAVRYEAYPGVLRGAQGAYTARAANAADRSLLLARLLAAQSVKTRFATARLSPDAAAALFEQMFTPPPAAAAVAAPGGGGDAGPLAQRVHERATRDFGIVTAALGERLPKDAAAPREQVLAEAAEHVWVQADVNGEWVDLDTAFADAAVGKRYAEPAQTADALPPELHQHVTIRVAIETLDGGQLKQSTALEVRRPAVELIDQQVFLMHTPPAAFKALGAAMAGGADAWTPTLWVDGGFIPGTAAVSFADGAATGKPKAALQDAFDALSADPAPAAAAASGPVLVAEVLEIEIALPGGRTEVTRRALVDRASPAWRAAAKLDAATLANLPRDAQGVVPARTVHNLWLSAGGHDLWSYAQAVLSIATTPPPEPGQPPAFETQAWTLAVKNFSTVLWADHVLLPAMNAEAGVRFYCDSPRVLLFSTTAVPVPGQPGETNVETQVDLRRDVVRGVAKDPAGAAAVARGKVWYGVAGGALEHEVTAVEAAALWAEARVVSTSGVADGAGSAGAGDAKVVATPADVAKLAAPPTHTAAFRAAAGRDGDVLVVPAAALAANATPVWWAVAPTGATRAVLPDGTNGGRYSGVRNLPRVPAGQARGPGGTYTIPENSGRPPGGGRAPGGRPPPRGGGVRGPAQSRAAGHEYFVPIINISVPAMEFWCYVGATVSVTAFVAIHVLIFTT